MAQRRELSIASTWVQVAVLTFVVGFAVMGFLAYVIHQEQPPIPERVLAPDGKVLFTADDIMTGQNLFQKYGLMQFGTLFGHGAYLGPDFTAQYLHRAGLAMIDFYLPESGNADEAAARVAAELKTNRYDPKERLLQFSPGQVHAFDTLRAFYSEWFTTPARQRGLQRPFIDDPEHIRQLTAYFAWAAWVSAAQRPNTSYSYTNNWPPEPLAGNRPTAEAFLWSVLSIIALLGGSGIVLYSFGRWDILGWHPSVEGEDDDALRFRDPDDVRLTPSQRAVPWYFLVVSGLFLVQGLLGGANAHYHVEPEGFYGVNIASWFPYNLTRMWHLQLALFFVSSSFLAIGIFITPMITGSEPRHQDKLALALFGALVVVVVGSLLGEAASIKGFIPLDRPWFWIGTQGWEYLDLGRLWQALLTLGMLLWLVIIVRGLWSRLRQEHPANLPYLFLYSALSIPLFYSVGMLFGRRSSFVIVDFWRFWVVHLWVEDFLELFTTIMVAYIFVLLGVVRGRTATRIVYLDIILYSVGGVIGTMHHLYFSGAPAVHMALGAFFSAMEVIPLLLLTYEAWGFMQLGSARGSGSAMSTSSEAFPHKWAVMFLIAVGFWNFLGAGIFGFLINLPIVSYYEIGTTFTANHGHGAMMGVYGMLALGFFMFVARYFVPRDAGSERAMKLSFWSLNIGLGMMLFVNLVPMGILQLSDSFANGYWHAREPEFFQQPAARVIEWLRLPGDLLFIFGGILPVVYLALRMVANRRRPGSLPLGGETEPLTEAVTKPAEA